MGAHRVDESDHRFEHLAECAGGGCLGVSQRRRFQQQRSVEARRRGPPRRARATPPKLAPMSTLPRGSPEVAASPRCAEPARWSGTGCAPRSPVLAQTVARVREGNDAIRHQPAGASGCRGRSPSTSTGGNRRRRARRGGASGGRGACATGCTGSRARIAPQCSARKAQIDELAGHRGWVRVRPIRREIAIPPRAPTVIRSVRPPPEGLSGSFMLSVLSPRRTRIRYWMRAPRGSSTLGVTRGRSR